MVSSTRNWASISEAGVNDRMTSLIESGREQATSVLERLQDDLIVDRIVEVGPKAQNTARVGIIRPEGSENGIVMMGDGDRWRSFHPHAAQQLASRMGIPGGWTKEHMTSADPWRRELIADVLQTTISNQRERDRMLVRSVGDTTYGVLSDSYRRLSSTIIARHFAESCAAVGAVPYRADHTDLRWSIHAMLPQVIRVKTTNHGVEHVAASVRLATSDFGCGALVMAFNILRLVCVNGMVAENQMRQVHLGGRLPQDLRLSEETYRSDSVTQALAVRDIVSGLLCEDQVRRRVEKIEEAASEAIDAEKEVKGLVRAKRITKAEADEISTGIMNRNGSQIPEGPVTRYSLAQALSWVAGKANVDRRDELERESGRLIGWGEAKTGSAA